MQLINCKVDLKLKWTKYCVLVLNGTENADTNSNNVILTIKDTKLFVLVVYQECSLYFISKIQSKAISERSVYRYKYEIKSEIKDTT